MLNISKNSINKHIELTDFRSYKVLQNNKIPKITLWAALLMLLFILVCLFLPWTQNIDSEGNVTTRSPQQRPQSIQSVISGRLEKWYVKEGDYVEKGDTIIFISEVKSEYFDPEILTRTGEQINAKELSAGSYDLKINALKNQYRALKESLELKKDQTRNKIIQANNKIKIDSADLVAYNTNYDISKNQLSRTKELYNKGLKTLTELQEKENKLQTTQAKVIAQENKLLNQRNEVLNLTIELSSIDRDYAEKLSKSLSDQQSAVSAKMETISETSKLKNQLGNYTERQKFYHILAPQSGYITKTISNGLGETVKEGTDIATIVPSEYDLALEIYIKPQDLPLINKGNSVRLRFDGWPAIVISGWPEASTGVFTGNIVAIDRFISANGNYRVLVSPDNSKKAWPKELSIGTGAKAFLLLKEVPIWYEIWRKLNGFPLDYYQHEKPKTTKK